MSIQRKVAVNEGDDLQRAIAHLQDDDDLTVTMKVRVWRSALERSANAPEWISTAQAAQLLGFSGRQWRYWCEHGEVAGAAKDAGGHWRLPSAAARVKLDAELHGTKATGPARPQLVKDRVSERPRSKKRGPWKKKTLTGRKP